MEGVVVGMQAVGGQLHGDRLLLLGPVVASALLGLAFVVWIDRRRSGPGAGRDLAVVAGLVVTAILLLVPGFLAGQ